MLRLLTLVVQIGVLTKAGEGSASDKSGSSFSQGGTTIETDTTCTVDGVAGKAVSVSSSVTGQKSTLDFVFPSFTESLAYDPIVS